MTWRRVVGLAVLAVVVVAGVAIWLSSRSTESSVWESGPAEWSLDGKPRGAEVRLHVESGYCDGAPKPRLTTRVTEAEDRVEIVAEVEEFVVDGVCAGIGLGLSGEVTLAEPLGDRILLDASEDPPEQRWPRGK